MELDVQREMRENLVENRASNDITVRPVTTSMKKIFLRVQDRLNRETDGTPHVNHTSHQEHQDTYTPPSR
jgi:hypothetical protein